MKKVIEPEYKFIECDSCAKKPGSPILCKSCLQNRDAIDYHKGRLKKLKEMLENWRENNIVLAMKYYKYIENEKGGHIRGFKSGLTSVIDKIEDNNY